MKRFTSVLTLGVMTLFFSCKKEDSNPTPDNGLPAEVNAMLPDSLQQSLESRGMTINRGNTPPNVEGIFLAHPMTLTSNFGPDDPWQSGRVVNDYLYRIYNQNGSKADMDYKSSSYRDTASGKGTFISGSGNKFSFFAKSTGSSGTIPYTTVSVISGEKTATGIRNFQMAFVLTEKNGDAGNVIMIPQGKSRIYKDGDGDSPFQSVYDF